jgi:aminocarboxymuconate-semialdehyde decarboxylase
MAVVDVHTHKLTKAYLDLLTEYGGPKYKCKSTKAGQESIHMYGAPFMTLMPEMWDYEGRIERMDKAGVDLSIVSLTCPNACFGDEATSDAAAAMLNGSMAEQQDMRPDRIGWFTSFPWQHADAALAELERTIAA